MKVRKTVLSFVVVVIAWGVATQADEGWMRYYTIGEDARAGAVLATPGGGFTVTGYAATQLADPLQVGIFLLHIEADGTLPYPALYDWGGIRTAEDTIATADGGWLFAGTTTEYGAEGRDLFLLRVDGPGQTLWSGVFGAELDENAVSIVDAVDGGYFAVGNQVDPNDIVADPNTPGYGGLEGRCAPYIVHVNDDGAPLWSKALRGDENVVVFDGAATEDGGCLILATVYGYPDAHDAIRLIKLDAEGEIVWTRTWSDGNAKGYALVATPDGRILVAGAQSFPEDAEGTIRRALLVLFDQDGVELWSRRYGDPGVYGGAHALMVAADGAFVVAGTRTEDLSRYDDDIFVLAVDALGDVLWEQTHVPGEHAMVHAIAESPEGGFAIVSTVTPGGERGRVLLLRTDEEGRVDGS